MKEMSVQELKAKLDAKDDFVLIDIREPHELEISKLDEAMHIPMRDMPDEMEDMDTDREYVILCRTGSRSYRMVQYMMEEGFTNVYSLLGGINDWASKIDPSMQQY